MREAIARLKERMIQSGILLGAYLIIGSIFGKDEESEQSKMLKEVSLELKERLASVAEKAEASSQIKLVLTKDRGAHRVTVRWADDEKLIEAKIYNDGFCTIEITHPTEVEKCECSGINHMFQMAESSLKHALSMHLVGVS